MLKFGNQEFRNLQEQVEKNMKDIKDILGAEKVLADFGIKILGSYETFDELIEDYPEQTSELEYGDAFTVGIEVPFNYYVWTRTDDPSKNGTWFNIGMFPQPGPAGEQGPEGPQGERGEKGERGLQGPRGIQGPRGEAGTPGERGPKGDKGDKGDTGDPGNFIHIEGILASEGNLPSPESLQDPSAAYLVGNDRELYIQISGEWHNLGVLNVATYVTEDGEFVNIWDSDTKLDKVTSTGSYNKLYGVGANGSQYLANVSVNTSAANTIPLRDSHGNIKVGEPLAGNDAASRMYVNNQLAGKLSSAGELEVAGNLYLGADEDTDNYIYGLDIAYNGNMGQTGIILSNSELNHEYWLGVESDLVDINDADYDPADYEPESFRLFLPNEDGILATRDYVHYQGNWQSVRIITLSSETQNVVMDFDYYGRVYPNVNEIMLVLQMPAKASSTYSVILNKSTTVPTVTLPSSIASTTTPRQTIVKFNRLSNIGTLAEWTTHQGATAVTSVSKIFSTATPNITYNTVRIQTASTGPFPSGTKVAVYVR